METSNQIPKPDAAARRTWSGAFNLGCLILGISGIVLFVLSFFFRPNVYHGPVHFRSGGFWLPPLGFLLLLTATVMWLIGKLLRRHFTPKTDRPRLRRIITPLSLLILLNFALFAVGVFFNEFGGWIDALGADLCKASYGIGILLVPVSILYAAIRYVQKSEADVLAVSLAILMGMILDSIAMASRY